MWKIREIEIANPVVIAPMAGISNSAFRTLAKDFGAGLIYSEMVSDKAICYSNVKTLDMTQISENEHPLTMQLFGSELKSMIQAAQYLDTKTDCDIIDINIGCPVPKIVKSNAGSAMMKDPEATFKLVSEIVKNVSKPVTAKIRLGWDLQSINCVEMAKGLEKAGISALAIHGRTKTQMYDGEADWSWIKKVKAAVSIPVIGNGDIKSAVEAKKRMDETGVDAVMVGRGVLGDPWVIREMVSYLTTGEILPPISNHEKLKIAYDHALRLVDLKGERVGMKEMRGHACWYIQGLPFNNRIKALISSLLTLKQFKDLIDDYNHLMELSTDDQAVYINELVDHYHQNKVVEETV